MKKLLLSLIWITSPLLCNKVNITNNATQTVVVEINWQSESTPQKLVIPSKQQANPSSKSCISMINIWLGASTAPVRQEVGGIPINLPEAVGKKLIYSGSASLSMKKDEPCFTQFIINSDGTVTAKR